MFQLQPECFTVSQMELHHQTHSTGKLCLSSRSSLAFKLVTINEFAVYVLVNNVHVQLNR